MTTHTDRILAFVAEFPGRDDDEIANALRIVPRQTVNAICRELEVQGLIARRRGSRGKLTNHPRAPAADNGAAQVALPDTDDSDVRVAVSRPPLTVETLLAGGFALAGHWILSANKGLACDTALPTMPGVYAFALDGRAHYVGLASSGLARRLRFYQRPGQTQRTSQRLNELLIQLLTAGRRVAIYAALPPDAAWNGLPVNRAAGLELGLIQGFDLPWNIRSANQRSIEVGSEGDGSR